MKKKIKIILSISISYISFYFIMNFILNEDILLSRSFKSFFFEATNEELITIILVINTLFYTSIFYITLKNKNNLITSKFKFIEYTFIGTIIFFIPYLYLILNPESIDFFFSYTNILFLLYISIYIFGALIFILTSKFLLSPKKQTFY
jgi:hypothetical protein